MCGTNRELELVCRELDYVARKGNMTLARRAELERLGGGKQATGDPPRAPAPAGASDECSRDAVTPGSYLDALLTLYEAAADKDMFLCTYTRLLAKRLLRHASHSLALERSIIAAFKA